MGMADFDVGRACGELKISKDVYLRIVGRAFDQTVLDLEALKKAHAQNDIKTIQSIAHRLKGDYANLRMNDLSSAAGELNVLTREGEYIADRALSLIDRFQCIFEELKLIIAGSL